MVAVIIITVTLSYEVVIVLCLSTSMFSVVLQQLRHFYTEFCSCNEKFEGPEQLSGRVNESSSKY